MAYFKGLNENLDARTFIRFRSVIRSNSTPFAHSSPPKALIYALIQVCSAKNVYELIEFGFLFQVYQPRFCLLRVADMLQTFKNKGKQKGREYAALSYVLVNA